MSSFTIYTDGGCKKPGGVGGWAWVRLNHDTGTRLIQYGNMLNATNNLAEMKAVEQALLSILVEPNVRAVELVSDSEYIVKGIKEWLPVWESNGWRKTRSSQQISNLQQWQAIYWLVNQFRNRLNVLHVLGHSGNPENELCDQLATQAMELYARDTGRSKTSQSG